MKQVTREINEAVLVAIEELVDYLWDDEERGYRDCDDKAGHVFESVRTVRSWLDANS
ncbi:MAG: hypothetical protein R3C28_11200 [Pirellulaceae bacterium]